MNLNVTEDLLKWIEKRIRSLLVLFLKYGRKISVEDPRFQKRGEIHFTVNLQFLPISTPPGKSFFLQDKSFALFQAEQLPKPPSSRHIENSISVYLFLEFEPYLRKSEFKNVEMKENKAFNLLTTNVSIIQNPTIHKIYYFLLAKKK